MVKSGPRAVHDSSEVLMLLHVLMLGEKLESASKYSFQQLHGFELESTNPLYTGNH